MKNKLSLIFSALFLVVGFFAFAENTVVVLEFETKDVELRDKMPILTDIFRSELANTQSINVVDRANTDKALAEISLQQSNLMSGTNVKSVGKILNADYLVIGTFVGYKMNLNKTSFESKAILTFPIYDKEISLKINLDVTLGLIW